MTEFMPKTGKPKLVILHSPTRHIDRKHSRSLSRLTLFVGYHHTDFPAKGLTLRNRIGIRRHNGDIWERNLRLDRRSHQSLVTGMLDGPNDDRWAS